MLCEVELGLGELGAVGLGLQIEIERWPGRGHFERQRGLTRLAWTQQSHRRHFVQGGGDHG